MGNIAEKNGVTNLNAKYLGLEDIRETNGVYSPQRVPSGSLNVSFDPANESTFQTSSTNYNDLQGNVTGTVNGSPTYDSKGFFDFDGVNDYIEINNTTSPRSNAFSEVVWVKPSFFTQTGLPATNINNTVLDSRDRDSGGLNAGGMRLTIRWNSTEFRWRCRTVGSPANNTDVTAGTHSADYFDGTKWYMCVIVRDATSTQGVDVEFYLNDSTDTMQLVNSSSDTSLQRTIASSQHTHGANAGGGNYADIEIGEQHQYNKLLSASEITDIWNKTKARYGY